MAEYNFKPDYAKWWSKRNVTKDEMLWLMFGINPDDIKKQNELNDKSEKTQKEQQWLWDFGSYWDSLDAFLGNKFGRYSELLKWTGNKKKFVKNAYEFYMEIDQNFLDYLESVGDFKTNQELEKYKDHSTYSLDPNNTNLSDIKSEDEAFAVLLGLNPEFFLRFYKLDKKNTRIEKNKSGFVEYINFTPDDKWFYSEYRKFIDKTNYGDSTIFLFIRVFEKAKEFSLWNGGFAEYAKALYNEGYIFKLEVQSWLESNNVILEYAENSWPIHFYKYWLHQGGWTLEESVSLFKGQDPRENHRCIIDLSQNPWILSYSKNCCLSWDAFENDYIRFDERLARHVAIGQITSYKYLENMPLYEAQNIVEWLLQNTSYLPPKALLVALGDTVLTDYEKYEEEKIVESIQTQRQAAVKSLAEKIEDAIGEKKSDFTLHTLPFKKDDVASYLKNNYLDCFCHIGVSTISQDYLKSQKHIGFKSGSKKILCRLMIL